MTRTESVTQDAVDTQGGAYVKNSVQVGGHFIGRDYITIINQTVQDSEDAREAQSVVAQYLHALVSDLTQLRLGDVGAPPDQLRQEPLHLADIYVPLETTFEIASGSTLAKWFARDRKPDEAGYTRTVSALEALKHHRTLTLLGKPGSGKSTFGARVLLALAQGWQGQHEAMEILGRDWQASALLPIRVVLRHFAESLPAIDQPAHAGDVWRFIACDLEQRGYGISENTIKYVQRAAREQGALILFDGLDECGAEARRQCVHNAVFELIDSLAGTASRFVLTARPYAWPRGPDPEAGIYALSDLREQQVHDFIRHWYEMLEMRGWCSAIDAERKCDDLLIAIERADLRQLTGNPLLLTLMAMLHTHRSRLPDDRVQLYDESVDLLLQRWNQRIGADVTLLDALNIPGLKLVDLREVLEELAFHVHEQHVGIDGTGDIAEHELLQVFRPLLNDSWDKAQIVVEYIEKRAGLLLGQGEKNRTRQFTFPHRTFQEFLAARHLQSRDDFATEGARLARTATSHWELVLLWAARLAGTERGVSAADELVGGTDPSDESLPSISWPSVRVAGMQLLEIGVSALHKSRRTRAIRSRVAGWLAAALSMHSGESQLPLDMRLSFGDLLGAVGDLRFDPNRFHLPADEMLGFVHLAADEQFRIGTPHRRAQWTAQILGDYVAERELNALVTPTPEIYISRYPVIVAQFGTFVESGSFKPELAEVLGDSPSRPVRWVSWHDALAYCDWLTNQLATSAPLAGNLLAVLIRERGWKIDLPSELEWEMAARAGIRDAIFPWGDDPDPNRGNCADTHIGTTSAVGCFPANAFGMHDMIGNVWEWTRSMYSAYPYDPKDGRESRESSEHRILRGGAFNTSAMSARCASALTLLPDDRFEDIGFRLVLRGPAD